MPAPLLYHSLGKSTESISILDQPIWSGHSRWNSFQSCRLRRHTLGCRKYCYSRYRSCVASGQDQNQCSHGGLHCWSVAKDSPSHKSIEGTFDVISTPNRTWMHNKAICTVQSTAAVGQQYRRVQCEKMKWSGGWGDLWQDLPRLTAEMSDVSLFARRNIRAGASLVSQFHGSSPNSVTRARAHTCS